MSTGSEFESRFDLVRQGRYLEEMSKPSSVEDVVAHGVRTPLRPHHRPSVSDTVAAPVPGLLSGGPNPGMQDKCPGYPSTLPAKAWLDHACSYASNEIAINWNAPLAYLAFALDAAYR